MLAQLAAEIARQIGHVVERIHAALVDPALQLFGPERLAAPLTDKLGERGGI